MNTRNLGLGLLAAFVLSGCATLPERTATSDRIVALVVESGGLSGKFGDAVPFLNSNLGDQMLPLKSGFNFLKVPDGVEEVRLKNLNISPLRQPGFPYRSAYLGLVFRSSNEGNILLVAKKLKYWVKEGILTFESTDLTETEIQEVVARWQKENLETKGPLVWTGFEVTRPETTRF